jgi:hypothetical protein
MRKFYQHIDLRSRMAMEAYLSGHFRYHTMNSWNRTSSYAHNLKVHNLGLDQHIVTKLFDMIRLDEFHDRLRDHMLEFSEQYDHRWQAGMNGRSYGYLVLYQGAKEPSGYRSYCTACGQRNYRTVADNGNICGVCRRPSRMDYPATHMHIVTYPGKGVDMDQDFEDWTLDGLRERVRLIQDFDRLADTIVAEAVWMANNCTIEEETYMVEQRRRVLVSGE